MPLTEKGETIKAALQSEYGKERGERILYAGKNAGTFTGIDSRADGAQSEVAYLLLNRRKLKPAEAAEHLAIQLRKKGHSVSPPGGSLDKSGLSAWLAKLCGELSDQTVLNAALGVPQEGKYGAFKGDALQACAATLDNISRRMDSLLIRQRTGHEKSRHDVDRKCFR